MNDQHLLQTWEITLLSSLHIGDGEELVLNMDYKPTNTGIDIIHPDDLLGALEDIPVAVSDEDKPGVILDYDHEGDLVSLEILDASKRVTQTQKIEFKTAERSVA
jgi:hypothetical protein